MRQVKFEVEANSYIVKVDGWERGRIEFDRDLQSYAFFPDTEQICFGPVTLSAVVAKILELNLNKRGR